MPTMCLMTESLRGSTWGPWQATLVNLRYWQVRLDMLLPPGRYQVVDSDPSTWSQTDGASFVQVKGYRQ